MRYLMLVAYTLPQAIVGGLGMGALFNSCLFGFLVGGAIFGLGLDVLRNGRKDNDDYPCK